MVAKRLDARVLERIEPVSDRANVVNSSQRVGVPRIVGRPAIGSATGPLPSFNSPKYGVDRFPFVDRWHFATAQLSDQHPSTPQNEP
jgi:hypothetical protein